MVSNIFIFDYTDKNIPAYTQYHVQILAETLQWLVR